MTALTNRSVLCDTPLGNSLSRAWYDSRLLEDASGFGTQVITMWRDTVLQVDFFCAKNKNPDIFYVGQDRRCNFPIQEEYLAKQQRFPLVVNYEYGKSAVNVLQDWRGDITYEDKNRIELDQMIGSHRAQQSTTATGCYCISLPQNARAKIDIGDFTFLVISVARPRKLKTPHAFDWNNQKFYGAAFALHFLIIFLAFFDPGPLFGFFSDNIESANQMIKFNLNAFETKKAREEIIRENRRDSNEGGTGKRHKFEEGKMGKRDAPVTNNKYGLKGPADNPDPRMQRDDFKRLAKEAGILKYLSSSNAPTSPFGKESALGQDPENALGALMGDNIGENYGFGALGMRGTGRGGGGTGEGTIGIGTLGTIGHGGGHGTGSGYGSGNGSLGGRIARSPTIHSGAVNVKGSLSKEVIRRIVHRHNNEIKYCYDKELAKTPDLAGRITVRFFISGTGIVQAAAVAESTMDNPALESCIANAVKRWSFPQPEGGGIVIVNYPFQFTSTGL